MQGFHRRILQLHLCLIYFFGGVTKCAGPGWWDGASIWRALVRPPFNLLPPETLIAWKNLFPILSISVLLLETGYPLFIWLRKTRTVWLVAVITMHLAIGLAMAVACSRLLQNQLFGVSALDPATFASISAALLGAAFLASYIPARRATKVDPLKALRYE